MKSSTFLLALAAVLFVSAPAFADTVVFYDDFESGVAWEGLGTSSVPVGSWSITGGVPTNSLYVNWAPPDHNGLPHSYAFGTMYGGTIRGMPEVAGGLYNYADAQFAVQNIASNRVRLEAEIYGQNAGATTADLKLAFLSGTTELNAVTLSGGASIGSVAVGGTATGLEYSLGAWHHVTMDYSPMTSTFSLAIDGQTPLTGLAVTTPSAVDGFRFVETSAGQDRWSCYDNVKVSVGAVPEPSSIALLVSAIMGLVAYAWRKRK
jgi:hypothetical protein